MSSAEHAPRPDYFRPQAPKKGGKAPWGAIAVVASLVLSCALGIYTCGGIARAQGGFSADGWRTGTVTVESCRVDGLSLGLRYECTGAVSWTRQEKLPAGLTLPEPPYTVYSPTELQPGSVVAVEAFLVDRQRLVGKGSKTVVEENIVTDDHPRGQEFWMWFQMLGPILWAILTFVVLGAITTLAGKFRYGGFGRRFRRFRRVAGDARGDTSY